VFDFPALRLHDELTLGRRPTHDIDDDAKPPFRKFDKPALVALIDEDGV